MASAAGAAGAGGATAAAALAGAVEAGALAGVVFAAAFLDVSLVGFAPPLLAAAGLLPMMPMATERCCLT
jgi:hypothetical protein